MNNQATFRGLIPPVSTLFTENGKLDQESMKVVIDKLISDGVDGLFFLGTGGEFSQMTVDERKEVASFATEYVNGRVPVLIGTGSVSTREVIELNQHSKQVGADAVVVINPYYWPLSDDNLFQHYAEIAENTDLPILLYNFPGLTGQDLTPGFVLSLVEKYPNIVGIKETVDTAGHIREMILTVKAKYPHFSVLCGFDDHLLNTLTLGGDGAISASGNFAPELQIGIYQAYKQGNYEKAIELHQRLAYLPLMYKLDSPFVNVVKEAMKLRGIEISSTYVLPPARPLTEEKKLQLKEILQKADLL
ncbi:dihydrodipicolinate synthase family protein [Desertibacillus haloalkaliphilus]|uniref:dihydrodipicolinate synthase family protein n=1 Tax=Desertibacillus haloalkaliphilus TaxID=1328930 RepID=UPI001C261063|nr:dihydrodipicolinate synthase family protein [Desertibacillus haloalkaliphilus]MBU8909015.1 dihydrodipicolinate synthase family protein [Desertibacillus haloalkaliphilus]